MLGMRFLLLMRGEPWIGPTLSRPRSDIATRVADVGGDDAVTTPDPSRAQNPEGIPLILKGPRHSPLSRYSSSPMAKLRAEAMGAA